MGRFIYCLIKKEKSIRKLDTSKDELPFVRDDYHKWNTTLMVFMGAFFLLPRCLIFLIATFCHYLVVKVVVMV